VQAGRHEGRIRWAECETSKPGMEAQLLCLHGLGAYGMAE